MATLGNVYLDANGASRTQKMESLVFELPGSKNFIQVEACINEKRALR
jgi:hypothetical protein